MKLCFLDELQDHKNLLGFSAGVDSVSMFFSLLELGIEFDVSIVNYGTREASDEESEYAQDLCRKYHKRCFVLKAPRIESNFECEARKIRFDFFEDIIVKNNYDNLILAHHLNDKLEWFLMQLAKGSGLNTILGFDGIEQRERYKIIRPFINITKSEIYEYCSKYKFYEDSTNEDSRYKRNEFRYTYSNKMIKKYSKGISKSFEYLTQERKMLYKEREILYFGDIVYFQKCSPYQDIDEIDKIIKKMGYVISSNQRKEILRTGFSCEIATKYIVENNENYLFVSKIYIPHFILPKKFKDIARKNAIPRRIRSKIYEYMHQKNMTFDEMNHHLKDKFI
ncbi:tRNA lysidine(34) synthetase TilS [Helicobacter sp. 13S00482-2]|uniref:tRNA lysidine(34) synthetase TilS n=1 Tax=Helicobacter sp. 13S00482-2 TaxID=1476200 RepID=UPI000BA5112A|nr:tRNA lysidine(34) synthetase TilS [Helicobacter sp. 13S00482-2]PAF54529.1 tRNA lysidine(34) synthetase TilS [Helicobacter sp. 13S00482-2]